MSECDFAKRAKGLPERFCHATIPPVGNLVGARLMAGQLTLDQLVEVRILCPQHKDPFERGSFRLSRKLPRMARVYT